MKVIALFLLMTVVGLAGCGDRSERTQGSADQVAKSNDTAPDNTGRNERDRGGETKTPGDQSENEADRTITQNVRQAITSDDALSTSAQNVKIVTSDGTVTLRGPVKSEKEKQDIEAKAKQVAGVKRVENELEIAG